MKLLLAILALLAIAGSALANSSHGGVALLTGTPEATMLGGSGYNIFYGGVGAQTMSAPVGSVNRFIYGADYESNTAAHDHIMYFDPATNTLDVGAICHGQFAETCFGPSKLTCPESTLAGILADPGCFDKGAGTLYYQWIPVFGTFYTAIFGDFAGTGHPDFYIAIEGGKLPIARHNFDFGNR